MVRYFSKFFVAALCAVVAVFSVPAFAQEKSGVRPGFEDAQIQGHKIVLFRPDVKVGEQSTAGIFEPRSDWTEEARRLMDAELQKAQAGLSNELVLATESYGDDAQLIAEYRALFSTVASSIVEYQFFPGNRLPTQKKGEFDWTLGEGASRLKDLTGARYGLFIYTEDHYGSTGRKILQFAAAGLFGAAVKSGVHIGYAGLVDLETGHILWLNADGAMGGDVREAEGMEKRVRQLLEDFPGSVAEE